MDSPHGYGFANDAGEEFLTFFDLVEATVCNTWFKKRDIFKKFKAVRGTALTMPSCVRETEVGA